MNNRTSVRFSNQIRVEHMNNRTSVRFSNQIRVERKLQIRKYDVQRNRKPKCKLANFTGKLNHRNLLICM